MNHNYYLLKLFIFLGTFTSLFFLVGILKKNGYFLVDNECLVLEVYDGDTIQVKCNDGTYKVRLIGIDTPETHKPNTPVQCYGEEATEFAKSIFTNKLVKLEKDITNKDIYDRLLRYVWIGDLITNEIIAKKGYAYLLTIPPNVKYTDTFKKAITEAQENNLGLWNDCKNVDKRAK
ncbi:thermonuclease family protein [bacterium]|nr:MAG: thermonuclease family protein [bacterium]